MIFQEFLKFVRHGVLIHKYKVAPPSSAVGAFVLSCAAPLQSALVTICREREETGAFFFFGQYDLVFVLRNGNGLW